MLIPRDKKGRFDSFFFFQAEDGIRDYKVTGVQTCALPIYLSSFFSSVIGRTHMLARAQVNQQLIVIVNLVLLSRGQALCVKSLS